MANRLSRSSSPYLLQHKDNPVDWREWGEEALAEARSRDVPVLLSVGYAACHWCHVMAHESFEDEATAAQMNAGFVNVKVDREERPDVDAVYMEATQAMTGQGGWPMTAFLTPDGAPFYAGTYFPPAPRPGMPSFRQVLEAVSRTWRERRADVERVGAEVAARLAQRPRPAADQPPGDGDLDLAVELLGRDFDAEHGGFGGAPKFPPSAVLEFLLRHRSRTGSAAAATMAERTLVAMARSGTYDQLGGGFARYAVDRAWVVPHFEKMLYDNAQLLRVYAHWWRTGGDALAERIVRETAGFLLRDLRTPEGGFASALDADAAGVEGLTYAWSPEHLQTVLGADDGRWAASVFAVTPRGTFEHGLSTLQLLADPDDGQRFAAVRDTLFHARAARPQPARDDKVVAAWNGLAVAGLAEAGALLGEPAWVEAAAEAADLLVGVHLHEHGRLLRVSRAGIPGRHAGVLEDYGDVAEGLLALVAVTGDPSWLALAEQVLDHVLARFADDSGALFDTAADAEALVSRPQDPTDNAYPSGTTAAAGALLSFAALTGSDRHRAAAERALAAVRLLAGHAPRFAGWGLAVAEAMVAGPLEIAVLGPPADPHTQALVRVAWRAGSPGAVLAWGDPADPAAAAVPLLRDRPLLAGRPTAYVCRHFACQAPTSDPDVLAREVGAVRDHSWPPPRGRGS